MSLNMLVDHGGRHDWSDDVGGEYRKKKVM